MGFDAISLFSLSEDRQSSIPTSDVLPKFGYIPSPSLMASGSFIHMSPSIPSPLV